MSLGSNAINWNTTSLQPSDQRNESINLSTRPIQIVVVDVELCVRVCSPCGLEGKIDELFAEEFIEDAVAKGSILFKDLVDDIPGVDLALITSHHCFNVVLHDGSERGGVVDV